VRHRVAVETRVLAGLHAVHAWPVGSARERRVLFVHGMFGGAWVWDHWIGDFAARGWDCWAVTLGRPDRHPNLEARAWGLGDDVADVAAATIALGGPALVGHSLGGLLVLNVAERTSPSAVVALAPALPRGMLALRHLALLGVALRRAPALARGRPLVPERRLLERLALHRLDGVTRERVWRRLVPESGQRALGVVLPGVRVEPRRVRAPALFVATGGDRLTPASMVRWVARRYSAPCYEYARLGHMIPLEPEWPLVGGDVAGWLLADTEAPADASSVRLLHM
jgi:pimeloyl-ACP methyl ester carboxylesterase